MATQRQSRRGTTAEIVAMIPAEGEIVVDTVLKELRLGDGSTAGGIRQPTRNNPAFTGMLDLSEATAGQIKFPATQNASSNANTLDDYEEGTWTPILTFITPGDLAVTYSQQLGVYRKIGGLVFLSYSIQTSSFTHSTASSALVITGIPFPPIATQFNIGGVFLGGVTKASYTDFSAQVAVAISRIEIIASGSGVAGANVTASNMPSGGSALLRGSICYPAA